MTQQKAKVMRLVDGDRAEVAVRRQSACGHDCAQCGGGCSEMMVEPEIRVLAENVAGAQPGDTVTVESASKTVLGVAFLVYLLPFILFFTGYFVSSAFGEGIRLIAGGIGFVLGFVPAWLIDRRKRQYGVVQFRIVAVEQS